MVDSHGKLCKEKVWKRARLGIMVAPEKKGLVPDDCFHWLFRQEFRQIITQNTW